MQSRRCHHLFHHITYPSIQPSIQQSAMRPSIKSFIHQSVHPPSIHASIHASIYPSIPGLQVGTHKMACFDEAQTGLAKDQQSQKSTFVFILNLIVFIVMVINVPPTMRQRACVIKMLFIIINILIGWPWSCPLRLRI